MSEQLWAAGDVAEHGAFVALFLLALVCGAAPERILAGMAVAALLVHRLYHILLGTVLVHGADLGHLAVDIAWLAGIFAVALRANRVYPLWIGGMQIVAVMAHVYRLCLSEITSFACDLMSTMPSYFQLLALALGLTCHVLRRKRLGSYPSWRSSFASSAAHAPIPYAAARQ